MPTTLTGLLLFVVLLLPGFAYLVGKERAGTERRTSPFRETIAIVAASITSELVMLAAFAVVRCLWPQSTPDVGALLTQGTAYAKTHYAQLTCWGVGMLLVATALAYAATLPAIRGRLPGAYPHDSTVSAWGIMFAKWRPDHPDQQIRIGCQLEDGSFLAGRLASFDISADDHPDRDLILLAPIDYQAPGSDELQRLDLAALSVSARRILWVGAKYYVPGSGPGQPPSP